MNKVIQSSAFLAVFATAFIMPLALGSATHATKKSATYQTEVFQSLKMTIPEREINVVVDPSTKPFDSQDLTVTVATNNDSGYYMTMTSDSASLIKNNDATKTIPTLDALDGGYTESTFQDNKWGYKIGAGNYTPFVSGAEIARSDVTTNGDTTTLTFATKVDFLQAAGIYQTEINFVAVINPALAYMQDFEKTMCTETPQKVVDLRDGERYTVQQLADGNCWMLDNLRLDPTEVPLKTLKGNTNAPNDVLRYFKDGGGSSPYPASGVSSEWTSSNQNSYDLPYINADYKDTISSTIYGLGSNKLGVYYNYCAASAGSFCYSKYGTNPTSDAIYDICPAGWRLPKGGETTDPANEFNNLYVAYGSDRVTFEEALSTPLPGGFYGGSTSEQGTVGFIWSSTLSNNRLYYSSYSTGGGIVQTSSTGARNDGYSVRCILADPEISQVSYLQDARRTMVNKMDIGDTATLVDKRDGEEYLVGKLADGNLWLLENLRLDPTAVSLEVLQDNTNATDTSLYYLKNGGGEEPYASSGVVEVLPSVTDEFHEPYVHATDKNTLASMFYDTSVKGKSGTFYNYCAASAGSYCYGFFTEDTGDAKEDICPSGWRLPTGGEDGETGNLYQAYESNNIEFAKQFKAVKTGEMRNEVGVIWADHYAIFWTSTFPRYGLMEQLWFDFSSFWGNSGSVGLDTNGSTRGEGMLVRCILK